MPAHSLSETDGSGAGAAANPISGNPASPRGVRLRSVTVARARIHRGVRSHVSRGWEEGVC